jgi:hypothetical protein
MNASINLFLIDNITNPAPVFDKKQYLEAP